MPLFSNIHTRRCTIYAVLLVWLFALASSWAYACQLQERQTHGHAASSDGVQAVQLAQVSPAHVGIDADHAENADPAKRACLKVCGDGSQSAVKQAPSVDLTGATMVPPVALAWSAALAIVRQRTLLALPAPSPGLPLRTRFARLAL